MVAVRPKGTNVFKITVKQPSIQPSITDNADSRGVMTGDWNLGSEPDRFYTPQEFSEKIPEVWKNQTFNEMQFTIEKCRDLK